MIDVCKFLLLLRQLRFTSKGCVFPDFFSKFCPKLGTKNPKCTFGTDVRHFSFPVSIISKVVPEYGGILMTKGTPSLECCIIRA